MGKATSPTAAAAQKDSFSPASPLPRAHAISVAFSVRVLARHLKSYADDDVGVYLLGSAVQVGAWDADKAGNND